MLTLGASNGFCLWFVCSPFKPLFFQIWSSFLNSYLVCSYCSDLQGEQILCTLFHVDSQSWLMETANYVYHRSLWTIFKLDKNWMLFCLKKKSSSTTILQLEETWNIYSEDRHILGEQMYGSIKSQSRKSGWKSGTNRQRCGLKIWFYINGFWGWWQVKRPKLQSARCVFYSSFYYASFR